MWFLKSQHHLDTYIADVDKRLRNQGVLIHQRPIKALLKISEENHLTIMQGDHLSEKIIRWFDQKYGDRLKVDWSVGRTVILLDGDPFVVNLPRIYGQVKVEPLKWIENATVGMLARIPDEDIYEVANIIMNRYQDFSLLEQLPSHITADLGPSVQHIMSVPSHLGLSKWASLQVVEKTMKFAIESLNEQYPKTHNLRKLRDVLASLSVDINHDQLVNHVQCSPSIRYEGKLSLTEAIDAHHSAIRLCCLVAEATPSLNVHVGVELSEKNF